MPVCTASVNTEVKLATREWLLRIRKAPEALIGSQEKFLVRIFCRSTHTTADPLDKLQYRHCCLDDRRKGG